MSKATAEKPYFIRELPSGLWELCRVTWRYDGKRTIPLKTFLTEQAAELALRGMCPTEGVSFKGGKGDYVEVYAVRTAPDGRVRHGHIAE